MQSPAHMAVTLTSGPGLALYSCLETLEAVLFLLPLRPVVSWFTVLTDRTLPERAGGAKGPDLQSLFPGRHRGRDEDAADRVG